MKPAKVGDQFPVLLVMHENRRLNPHIEDVPRRLALEGFIAFAPDAPFPLGGYPGDEDAARTPFGKLDQDKTHADLLAAADMFGQLEGGNGRMGAVGFCYGGAMTNFLATELPELAAAAPFYGPTPSVEKVDAINAELLVALAANDERVNSTWPAYEAALEKAGDLHAVPAARHPARLQQRHNPAL